MYENINALVMDDDIDWRNDFRTNLEEFGIENVDAVSFMAQALDYLTKKNYQIMVLDTNEGTQISGPNVAKKAIELGQKPIIFAVSRKEENTDLWKNLGFEYTFFNKRYFDDEMIYSVLKQKLPKE